jgi:copper chaperone CopZ
MSVTTTYAVAGMSCDHCARAVTVELTGLAGVEGVRVDVPAGSVTVVSAAPLPEAAVRSAVDEAGYQLTGVTAA